MPQQNERCPLSNKCSSSNYGSVLLCFVLRYNYRTDSGQWTDDATIAYLAFVGPAMKGSVCIVRDQNA